jgi:hypothetical protein
LIIRKTESENRDDVIPNSRRGRSEKEITKPIWKVLLSSLLAFLSLVGSFYLIFLPNKTDSFTYSWAPSDSLDSGVFPLDRSWPKEFEISFENNCDYVSDTLLFSSGGFEIYCIGEEIYAKSGAAVSDVLNSNIGDEVEIVFDSEVSALKFYNFSNGDSLSRTLVYSDFPKFSQLVVNESIPNNFNLVLTTRPASLSFDPNRLLLLFVVFALGFSSVFLFSKKSKNEKHRVRPIRSYWPQSILVFVGLFSSSLVMPMFYDDGWVLQRVSQYLETGYFGDFYFHSNAWLPQSYITETLLSLLYGQGVGYLGLRVFVSMILFVSWLFILQSALLIKRKLSKQVVWLAAGVYLSIAGVWSLSLRAESWVTLFLAVQLYFFTKFVFDRKLSFFLLSSTFAGLSLSTHQSGFVSLIPLLAMGGFALYQNRWRISLQLLLATLVSVSIILSLFFVGYDFNTILSNVRDFSDDAYQNRLNELSRIAEITGNFVSSARKFGALIILVVLVFALSKISELNGFTKFFSAVALIMPSGLLLTSSKWGWHIAVLALPISLLVLLVFDSGQKGRRGNYRYSILLPVLVTIAGISFASIGIWGTYDHRALSWDEYSDFFTAGTAQLFWALLVLVSILIGLLIDKFSPKYFGLNFIGTSLTVLLIMLPATSSAAWIVADSLYEKDPGFFSWTMLRQNLKSVLVNDKNSCGILGSVPAYTSSVQPLQPTLSFNLEPMLTKVKPLKFPWELVSAWSSELNSDKLSNTPVFQIPESFSPSDSFSIWWQSDYSSENLSQQIVLTKFYPDGTSTSEYTELLVPKVGGVWNKYQFKLEQGLTGISFATLGNEDNFIIITQPVRETVSTAVVTLSAGSTFIPPSYLPSVPCAELPAANRGLFPIPDFIVSKDYNLDTRMWIEQYFPEGSPNITELGKVEYDSPAIWRIEFIEAKKVKLVR